MRFAQKLVAFAAFALAIGSTGAAFAQAKTFTVGEGSKIEFVSDAPLERFTGTNFKISGEVKVDPAKAADAKGEIKVDAATFKTGVDLRDEHLVSDTWLDAKKYPNATFVITSIKGVSALKANEAADVTVVGKFSLHGVTKDVTATAKVRWVPAASGDTLRVQAKFTVNLEDHKVEIPQIVALKVSPNIEVNVDLKATAK